MARYLFLDIDGVLNDSGWINAKHPITVGETPWWRQYEHINPAAVERLNRITDATGAKIVISSTWRQGAGSTEAMQQILYPRGVTGEIIGITPLHPQRVREIEIFQWLRDNAGINLIYDQDEDRQSLAGADYGAGVRLLVLDDEQKFLYSLRDYMVKTEYFGGGLLDQHVQPAIDILLSE